MAFGATDTQTTQQMIARRIVGLISLLLTVLASRPHRIPRKRAKRSRKALRTPTDP
jgi:hypothetical protein